jgi:hypothetical protein
MRAQLQSKDCAHEDYFHLCFALGKALEDREQFDESFKYYHLGNAIKEKLTGYKAENIHHYVQRMKAICRKDVFSNGERTGCQLPDPIFVVGLPRSGSTLLEQILASHSRVDGTKELIQILAIAKRRAKKRKNPGIRVSWLNSATANWRNWDKAISTERAFSGEQHRSLPTRCRITFCISA